MPSANHIDLERNQLLSILSESDRRHLLPHLHAFDLAEGAVLCDAGQLVVNTWFPCGAALASFCVDADAGEPVEVALIGREGAIGGIVSNGSVPAYATAQVRGPGRFLRIKTAALEQAKIDSIHLRHWFSRYSDCLLAQVFQTAACNARHTIMQRACKWMLAATERTESNEIAMTQESLAALLGVGRTFVNRTISKLRQAGIVETRRGALTIHDLPAVRRNACGCSAAIENHFDTVLHGIYVSD